eukprot:TRINITY_DN215_c0_g1_i6.p1 TRINITY_DN215_c0_g1~~TRINITY_DN215_c0_g1_i6.p1  ORF type:complete len:311 (+),score=50.19 TRINITY_DN215_c0_g1_i6:2383-3315(+)
MAARDAQSAAFCVSPLPPLARARRQPLRLLSPPRTARGSRRARLPTANLPLVHALNASSVLHALTLNSCLFLAANALQQKVLTAAGLCHAFALGVILWSCLSWQGYTLCFAFLIFGSAMTRIGRRTKEALGIAEKRRGARGPENLWGAAAVSAICALAVALLPYVSRRWAHQLRALFASTLLIGYTSSLATKFADTTSSEIGKAFGRNTYLVTSLERVPRGTEGAVSVEGTLAGVVAASIASLYAWLVGLISNPAQVLICIVASFIATTVESFIGASIQTRLGWSNEFVNFVNTLIGALVAMGLHVAFSL